MIAIELRVFYFSSGPRMGKGDGALWMEGRIGKNGQKKLQQENFREILL